MPAPRKLMRPTELCLVLPEDERARLDLHLWSEVEGRVPKGQYQAFFVERLREFFGWRRLDLGAWGFPEGMQITGTEEALQHLRYKLDLYLKEGKT